MAELPERRVPMSELLSSLSMATDLAEDRPVEHGVRTCYVSLRLAETLKLSEQERSDVYYTALLQDVG
ncbi:MAG: hypothetical protein HY686_03870 [Chloroflexi bacterium]|nr:hypothetical protein [Chloroflexota bacterium]